MNRYEFKILPVCQAIHSSIHGASDPMDDDLMATYLEWLRMRVATWVPPLDATREFDAAVRRLVNVTISEAAKLREDER